MVLHLQFTYDTLVFLDASLEQMRKVGVILCCFEDVWAPGELENHAKSLRLGRFRMWHCLAASLCRQVDRFPSSYHGSPLGAPYRSLAIWDPLLKRVSRRLAS